MKMLHVILTYCVLLFSTCSGTNTNNGTINSNKKNVEKEQLILSKKPIEENSNAKKTKQQLSDSLKCNIVIVRKIDDKIDELTSSEIKMFLCTFSKECSRNVEYTEYSNEVLFKVLERYPSQFMECINLNSSIEFEYILSELSNPLFDINGKKLITKIQQVEGLSIIKSKIIESLKKAME